MVSVKGNSLYLYKTYIDKVHSPEVFEKILDKTKSITQNALRKPILSTESYDLEIEKDFIQAVEDHLGKEELIKLAKYDAETTLGKIFRFFLRVISPETAIANMQKMWDQEYDVGKIEVLETDKVLTRVRVTGFPYNDSFRTYHVNYLNTMWEVATGKKQKCHWKKIDDEVTEFFFYFDT